MKNHLNKLLKDWDANIAPDKISNAKIKKNIMNNLDKPVQHIEYRFEDPYFHIHKKVLYIAGIAATICFAFLLGTQFNKNGIKPYVNKILKADQLASLSTEEVMNLKKISAEIDNLFPEGVRMISQINDGDLQINTDDKKGLDNKEKVLIRYIVLKKDVRENKWKKIHVSNVIASAGEPIELKGKNSGNIWIYPAGKDVYAVQSQLQLQANGKTINLDFNGGQQVQITQRIKTIQENNMEYRIYQEVVRI